MNSDTPQSVSLRQAALDDLRHRRGLTAYELREAEAALAATSEALALSSDADAVNAFNSASANMAMLAARLAAFDEQVIPRAEAAVIEAKSAEAEAQRWTRYGEAKKDGEEAAEDLRRSFGPLNDELVRLQNVLRAAETLVSGANSDLPFGAEQLRYPESDVRDQWPRAVQILSEEEVDRWVYKSSGAIVPDEKLDRIEVKGPFDGLIFTGTRRDLSSTYRSSRKTEVVKVRCLKQEVLGQVHWREGRRLTKVDLGPLTAEATLQSVTRYIPIDPATIEPVLMPVVDGGDAQSAE